MFFPVPPAHASSLDHGRSSDGARAGGTAAITTAENRGDRKTRDVRISSPADYDIPEQAKEIYALAGRRPAFRGSGLLPTKRMAKRNNISSTSWTRLGTRNSASTMKRGAFFFASPSRVAVRVEECPSNQTPPPVRHSGIGFSPLDVAAWLT